MSYTVSSTSAFVIPTKPWRSISSSADCRTIVACYNSNGTGYIYISYDSGNAWAICNNSPSKEWFDVKISQDGKYLVACDNNDGYVWKTDIYSDNWLSCPNAGTNNWISVAITNQIYNNGYYNRIFACDDGGYIYVSQDSGSTWTEITSISVRNWTSIASSYDGTTLVACAAYVSSYEGGVFVSYNYGYNWTNVQIGNLNFGNLNWRSVDLSNDGRYIAACAAYTRNANAEYLPAIWKSNNFGYTSPDSWSEVNLPTEALYTDEFYSITISGDGTKLATCTVNTNNNVGYIYTSSNSGTNWIQTISGDWYSITASDNGVNLAACAYNSNIYTSNNSGANWTLQNIIGLFWKSIASDTTGTKLAACPYADFIYTSNDSGISWTQQIYSGVRNWQSIASSSDGTKLAVVVYESYVYTSTDSGLNWTEQTNSDVDSLKPWQSIASSADGTKLAVCSKTSNLYSSIITSDDSGLNWDSKFVASFPLTSIATSLDGIKLAVCTYEDYIYTSTNSGNNWGKNSNSSGLQAWRSIWASSSNGNILFACAENNYVYKSTDFGISWYSITASIGVRNWVSVTSSADGNIVAACAAGDYIYISTDSGISWSEQTAAGQRLWSSITSSSNGDKLAACVDSGTIWTLVHIEVDGITCENGSLINNFFNGDTHVEKFTTIPGKLNTKILENGDYADESVRVIFEKLKKYSYNESIFDKIKYSLAAFFPSIAFEQAYVEIINEVLTPLFVDGKITKDEYDKSLEVTAKELADKYPTWYVNNLSKIELAIIKYKYILKPN